MDTLADKNGLRPRAIGSGRSSYATEIAGLVLAACCLVVPASASAEESIRDILGNTIVECRGAIAWTDGPDAATPRVEALQIAAAEDADRIVVYAAERDTTPEDFLACKAGICTAHRVTGTSATTSVMRLTRGLDYGSGRVQYDLDAAFSVVSFSGAEMVTGTATGRGGFICDDALPPAVVSGDG